jgi:hypothetical protein
LEKEGGDRYPIAIDWGGAASSLQLSVFCLEGFRRRIASISGVGAFGVLPRLFGAPLG